MGEGSVLNGVSYTTPQTLVQRFVSGDVAWNSDGTDTAIDGFTLTSTSMSVKPSDCIGLYERVKLYKHFRITGVEYEFYKDALSSNNGSYATGQYADEWDNKHSKLVYNSMGDVDLGAKAAYSTKNDMWLVQSKGQLLPTLNGRKKRVRVKPWVLKTETYSATGSGTVSRLVRYPWLSTANFQNELLTGDADVFIPAIYLNPLLGSTAGNYDLSSADGRIAFSSPFQWLVRAKIRWQVKGKYYDYSAISNVPDPVNQLRNMTIKEENNEDDFMN